VAPKQALQVSDLLWDYPSPPVGAPVPGVTETEGTRRALAADLRELEARIPASFRSMKSLMGVILGSSALTAPVVRRFRSKRSSGRPSAEVVVRIVRDDV
jgi:hypothetical protein